jgi:hypothetical protein
MRRMNPFARTLLFGLALCAFSTLSHAQGEIAGPANTQPPVATTVTPESVVARYVEATKRRDWKASAALMHPDALKQLKQMFRPIVASKSEMGLGKMFFSVQTLTEYDRLSGQQAFERLMTAVTRQNPDVSSALATSKATIIGHVLEGPDTAHVVYRMTAKVQGISVTKLAVMPLKRSGNSWAGLLTGDIEGMAAALARATATQSTPKTAPKKPAPKRP